MGVPEPGRSRSRARWPRRWAWSGTPSTTSPPSCARPGRHRTRPISWSTATPWGRCRTCRTGTPCATSWSKAWCVRATSSCRGTRSWATCTTSTSWRSRTSPAVGWPRRSSFTTRSSRGTSGAPTPTPTGPPRSAPSWLCGPSPAALETCRASWSPTTFASAKPSTSTTPCAPMSTWGWSGHCPCWTWSSGTPGTAAPWS